MVIVIVIVFVIALVFVFVFAIVIVIVIIIILLSLEDKSDTFYSRSSHNWTPRRRKKLSVTGAANFKIKTVNGPGAGRLRELMIS